MGKKIDKFIEDLGFRAGLCEKQLVKFRKANQQIPSLRKLFDKLYEDYLAQKKTLGLGPKDGGKKVEDDPKCQQLRTQMTKIKEEYKKFNKLRDDTRMWYKLFWKQFERELKGFKDYLDKRAKSKSPFKSKSATTKAKKFIQRMDNLDDDLAKVWRNSYLE